MLSFQMDFQRKRWPCDTCGKQLSSKRKLDTHKDHQHGGVPLPQLQPSTCSQRLLTFSHTTTQAQTPHSVTFLTRMLVPKFAKKGSFHGAFKSQRFPRKRGSFEAKSQCERVGFWKMERGYVLLCGTEWGGWA